jgi:hypothetical protein
MKKYINGKYVKMTKAEIEELKARSDETPEPVKTELEKRLEKLEHFYDKVGKLLNIE